MGWTGEALGEGEIGHEREKRGEKERLLDHLEVGKKSRDEGRQREREREREREGKIGRMGRGMEMKIGDWGREG